MKTRWLKLNACFSGRHITPTAWCLTAAFGIALTGALLRMSGEGQPVPGTARRLEMEAREALGVAPGLHPKLKIFGFDDQAVARYGAAELPLPQWETLITALAAARPRVIVIDKIFSVLPHATPAEIQRFRATLLKNPIVCAGASLHPGPIKGRAVLSPLTPGYDLQRMAGGDTRSLGDLPIAGGFLYGPAGDIADAFRCLGLLNERGDGEVAAITRTAERVGIPHLGILASGDVTLEDGRPMIDGIPVFTRRDGTLPVNFSRIGDYWRRARSMVTPIEEANQGLPLSSVDPGDVVLLLPLLHTGNVDVSMTPVGRMPSGFIVAAVMNSHLNREWLRPVGGEPLFLLLGGVAGAVLGLGTGGILVGGLVLLGGVAFPAAGLLLFAFQSLVTPWFGTTASFVLCAIGVLLVRMRAKDREARSIRWSLDRVVPQEQLRELLKDPVQIRRDPIERVISMMFVDIAGFSLYAEETAPLEVFENLRAMLGMMRRVVHEHGGVVDKTLGDGLLCFFGYGFDGEPPKTNHADMAIECAVAMQRENLRAMVSGVFALPLRIGINTGTVYVGNLGSADRLDFTIIGSSVNFTQRLESAAEGNSIMLTQTTLDLASVHRFKKERFRPRMIRIKHCDELFQVLECDPLVGADELASQVAAFRRERQQANRRSPRWPIPSTCDIRAEIDGNPVTLVDFSLGGVSVMMKKYLARGVPVELTVYSAGEHGQGGDPFHVSGEVRWGRPAGAEALHGVQFKAPSRLHAQGLVERLRALCFGPSARDRTG